MQPFREGFTAPAWEHVLVLIVGSILSPGRRTVAAALRVMGLEQTADFTNYHRVLNRHRWSGRWVARCLFRSLVNSLVPTGPVVMGLDDTIERRWGAKINARGIYRDPVRSSHGHFVKASGLRWLSILLLPEIPWAGRIWTLPFLTVLAPSERYTRKHKQRHKKLTDRGRQVMLQVARRLPERQIIAVTDSGFAAIELLNAVRHRISMITRLRLDARLFDPPACRRPGTIGRPRVVGRRQPTLTQRLANSRTRWRRFKVNGWYGRSERLLQIVSGTAIWHHPGRLVPIRYGLVRDVAGEFKPQAFLCTDLDADANLFRPAAQALAGSAGPHTAEGACFAEAECCAEEQEDGLDERGRLSIVQCPAAQAARRHRHRTLVPYRYRAGAECGRRLMAHRCPAGLDPLGSGP